MNSVTVQSIVILAVCLSNETFGQTVASDPFSNFPVSPDAGGMGGVSISLPSYNALASASDPAQLGLFSLDGYFNAAASNAFDLPGAYRMIRAESANFGIRMSSLLSTQVPIGLGIGYSRVQAGFNDYDHPGNDGPTILGQLSSTRTYQGLTIALGIECAIRIGLGVNLKLLDSQFDSPSYPPTGSTAESGSTLIDYGIMAQLPLSALVFQPPSQRHPLSPLIDIALSFARNNIVLQNELSGSSYAVHPPRQAAVGLSVELGVTSSYHGTPWNVLSLTFAAQAADPLVRLDSSDVVNPTTGDTSVVYSSYYTSTPSHIRTIQNIILGRSDGTVELRRGMQLQFAEFLFIRLGSIQEVGGWKCTTTGWGLHSSGLVKLLSASASDVLRNNSLLSLLAYHLDLQFDHTSFSGGEFSRTYFDGINIVVK